MPPLAYQCQAVALCQALPQGLALTLSAFATLDFDLPAALAEAVQDYVCQQRERIDAQVNSRRSIAGLCLFAVVAPCSARLRCHWHLRVRSLC